MALVPYNLYHETRVKSKSFQWFWTAHRLRGLHVLVAVVLVLSGWVMVLESGCYKRRLWFFFSTGGGGADCTAVHFIVSFRFSFVLLTLTFFLLLLLYGNFCISCSFLFFFTCSKFHIIIIFLFSYFFFQNKNKYNLYNLILLLSPGFSICFWVCHSYIYIYYSNQFEEYH